MAILSIGLQVYNRKNKGFKNSLVSFGSGAMAAIGLLVLNFNHKPVGRNHSVIKMYASVRLRTLFV